MSLISTSYLVRENTAQPLDRADFGIVFWHPSRTDRRFVVRRTDIRFFRRVGYFF